MIFPSIPANEVERLNALKSYAILDSPNEKEFDDLTKLASQICGTPISLISLIDADRQWFKSNYGLKVRETSRDYSFCAHAINSPKEPFIIEDTGSDPRFFDNPLVKFEPKIVFYAGFPLINNEGFVLGTLCTIDHKPRKLNTDQLEALQTLSNTIIKLLELYRKNTKLGEQIDDQLLYHKIPALIHSIDSEGRMLNVSDYWISEMGYSRSEVIGRKSIDFLSPQSKEKAINEILPKFFKEGKVSNVEYQYVKKNGEFVDMLLNAAFEKDSHGNNIRSISVSINNSQEVKIKQELDKSIQKYKQDLTLLQSILESPQDIIIFALDTNYCYKEYTQYHKLTMKKSWGVDIEKGMNMLDVISKKDDKVKAKSYFDRALAGEYFTVEEEYGEENHHRAIYEIRYSPIRESSGKVIGISAFSIDITERKKAESKNEIFQKALDNSEELIFIINKDGNLIDVSQTSCKILGYTKEELLTMGVPDFDPNYSKEIWPQHWDELREKKTMTFPSQIKTKAGNIIETEVNVNYLIYNNIEYNVALTRDVTLRRKIEAEKEFDRLEKAALINSTSDLIWSVDVNFCLIAANNAFYKLLEKLTGNTFKKGDYTLPDHLPKENIDKWKSLFTRALQGETIKEQYKTSVLDVPKPIWFEITCNPIINKNEIVGLACFGRNITEQKETEAKIRENNEKLHFIEQYSSDGFSIIEDSTAVYISPSIKKLFNTEGETMVLKDIFELIDVRDRNRILNETIKYGRDNKIAYQSYSYRIHIGNETKWLEDRIQRIFDDNGELLRTLVNTRDITTRKIAEDELLHTKELLEDTNRVARIGNWELNLSTKNGNISSIAKSILEVEDNYQPSLLSILRFFKNTVYKTNLINGIRNAMESDIPFDVELPAITAKGKEIWLRTFGKVDFESGKCIRLFGAIQDITDRKNEEQELQELLKVTSDQSKRFQNFAYIISHNIRSHTANFTSLLDIIEHDAEKEEREKFIQLLRPCANNLEETIQNLNDIISIQTNANLQKSSVILEVEIEKTIQIIGALVDETNTKVINELPKGLSVKAIPAYVESIILNLITNAIKYRKTDVDPVIKISHSEDEDFTIINFTDNGKGIDLDKFGTKIFKMYKTFHGNADARGMGLYITKEQIEAMNGKIEIQSKVNEGTTFKVYFKNLT